MRAIWRPSVWANDVGQPGRQAESRPLSIASLLRKLLARASFAPSFSLANFHFLINYKSKFITMYIEGTLISAKFFQSRMAPKFKVRMMFSKNKKEEKGDGPSYHN